MKKYYFRFDSTLEPSKIKPIPTHLMIESFNKVWEWAKKFRNLQNATDKSWTEEMIMEMIEGHDALLEQYPYPFVENLLNTFLKEFMARNDLGYTVQYYEEDDGEISSLPEKPAEPTGHEDDIDYDNLPDDVFG